MVAPRLGTQSRLFPARGRAWGPSPDRCLGDDSLAHCLLDRASARPWLSHQSLALKGSSYLWAELAARSRTENLRPGAGGTSNSWGTRVHRPSRQEHTHFSRVHSEIYPDFVPRAANWRNVHDSGLRPAETLIFLSILRDPSCR